MSLPNNLFAAAFREQRLGFVFSFLVAIMVYLATLALAAQFLFGGGATLWRNAMDSRATIEIQLDDDDTAPAKLEQALAVLRTMPDMENVTPIPRAELSRLLKPWIDDPLLLTVLPLPHLIDIQVQKGHLLDVESITQALAPFSTQVKIDRHATWMEPLARLVHSLSLIAGFFVFLIALAFIIAIMLVCRVAMAVQHETIDLLHLMGAPDKAIAGQFQKRIARMSWIPSVTGFAAAVVTMAALTALYIHVRGQPLTLDGAWLVMGALVALVPLSAVAVAVLTARLSVLRLLRPLP